MKRLVIFLSVMTALVFSKATIDDTATLFKNTLKKWNIEVRDKRDYMERYKRLVEMKRRVDDTTTGVIHDTLNRFSVNNDQEHEMVVEMTKRNGNLTAMTTMIDKEKEKMEGVVEISKRSNIELSDSYDFWEKTIGFSEPRQQSSCGACWMFPNIATMEVLYKYKTGEHVKFSPGYFLDCSFTYSGCSGGTVNEGYKLTKDRQYLMYEKDWPYTADYQGCQFTDDIAAKRNNALIKMWFSDWIPLGLNEKSFLDGLLRSPVAFSSYISQNIYSYFGGIYDDALCATEALAHGQLLIGYTPEYLRVRGSYGTGWGDNGYINYKRTENLQSCRFFNQGYTISMDKKREMQYEFCSNAKPVNRDTCNESCEAMNKEGETGWRLAIIPTVQHNNELVKMANDRWPGVKSDDKFNYLFIGLLGEKGSENGFIEWEDKHTEMNYANMSSTDNLSGVFGLINKNSGRWTTRGNPKFEARGFCSRPRTCWDFSSHIPNAQVVYSHEDVTNLVEGTTAQVKCKEPCIVKGDSFSKCHAGLWSGTMEPKVSCSCYGDNDREENHEDKKDGNENKAEEKEEDEKEKEQEDKEDGNNGNEDEKEEEKHKENEDKNEDKEDKNKEEGQKEKEDENTHNKDEKEEEKQKDKEDGNKHNEDEKEEKEKQKEKEDENKHEEGEKENEHKENEGGNKEKDDKKEEEKQTEKEDENKHKEDEEEEQQNEKEKEDENKHEEDEKKEQQKEEEDEDKEDAKKEDENKEDEKEEDKQKEKEDDKKKDKKKKKGKKKNKNKNKKNKSVEVE